MVGNCGATVVGPLDLPPGDGAVSVIGNHHAPGEAGAPIVGNIVFAL